MTSPYSVLELFPEVRLQWTNDERVLRGREARWYPHRKIVLVKQSLRRLTRRCAIAHELGHVVLGHGPCGNRDTLGLYDYRAELAADEFAARLLLDDLPVLATELATTRSHGHAAANLNVTLDIFEIRLQNMSPDEAAVINELVAEIQAGEGC